MVTRGVLTLFVLAAFLLGCSVGMLINESLYKLKDKIEKRKEDKSELKGSAEDMTENEILITAINTFGETAQEGVAIEECAELIQAISHKHRGRKENIAEEIADVEIMLEQLKIINNCRDEVAEIHKQKINRLYHKVFDMCL